ncbi:MAG TPA: hypothetical protein DC034_08285, partial [Clostridium sp.]|nr:hypothetical protein [Clostridium sp.]
IDVSQKQEYIYKDSKIIDNLYNSFIIKAVTEELSDLDNKNNKDNKDEKDENIVCLSKYLKELNVKYSFVYSGGGNSILRFESKEDG